jgi:hypothetical protein
MSEIGAKRPNRTKEQVQLTFSVSLTARKVESQVRLARAATAGVLGASLLSFLALPGTASATPKTTYTAQAQAAGLVINLFGTQVTGGEALVKGDSAAPSALAEGIGMQTPTLVEELKAAVSTAGQSQSSPKACSQAASLPSSAPVGVTLGLACASASAAINDLSAPTASATGDIAGFNVNVSGLLNQILSSGGDQLFSALQQVLGQLNGTPLGTGATACPDASSSSGQSGSSTNGSTSQSAGSGGSGSLTSLLGTASTPGTPLNSLLGSLGLSSSSAATSPGPLGGLLQGLCQTLTNIENVVKGANPPPTLVTNLGPASASLDNTSAGLVVAKAEGATAHIEILPEVGCDASTLAACVTNASAYAVPLIDITVAPAEASDTFNGTSWTPATQSALATVDLNIPGDPQTITVGPGQSLDLLAGTPLETVIDLGSASANGADNTSASGASIDLAKGVDQGILFNLGSSSVHANALPQTAAAVVKSAPPAATPTTTIPAATPTIVHTGAWWSGSLPYIIAAAVLGAGLLGWPRLRRRAGTLGALLRAARR